jgi:porin
MATSGRLHGSKRLALSFVYSLLLLASVLTISLPAAAQSNDTSTTDTSFMHRKYLLGDWGGERSKLADEGVTFDLFYVSDFLANPTGGKSGTSAWNRVRGTVDIDFGKLARAKGLTLHVTGLYQGGVNLGAQYLGSVANPSGLVSAHTTRLDSYWLQQELFNGKLTVRGGQFAGQDFYGVQYYGREYLMEPLDYALGNLFSAYESFDPASGPAVDIKIAPMQQVYLRSAYMSGNRNPYGYNATGVPFTWKNSGLIINELGFLVDQPSFYGQRAAKQPGTAGTTPARTKFYPGLYKLGLVNNPGRNAFAGPAAVVVTTNSYVRCYSQCYSGDYIFYFMANQAVWRPTEGSTRGLDANFAVDYLPSDRNKVNQQFTGGLIFNAPIAKRADDTASFGFVISKISDVFNTYQQTNLLLPPQTSEKAFEINYLAQITPFWYVQPVVQVYASLGATPSNGTGVVLGFRTKVTF